MAKTIGQRLAMKYAILHKEFTIAGKEWMVAIMTGSHMDEIVEDLLDDVATDGVTIPAHRLMLVTTDGRYDVEEILSHELFHGITAGLNLIIDCGSEKYLVDCEDAANATSMSLKITRQIMGAYVNLRRAKK